MNMSARVIVRTLLSGAFAALLASAGGLASAQDYPSKTIKIFSPSAPGGLTAALAGATEPGPWTRVK